MRDKSCTAPCPILSNLENNGWNSNEDGTACLRTSPMHQAICSMCSAGASKCGCRKSCSGNCSCLKKKLTMHTTFQVFAWCCNRYSSNQGSNDDDNDENEDDTK